MRWTDDRGGNVEDRRGLGGGAVVGGGLGTLIIAAIIFFWEVILPRFFLRERVPDLRERNREN
jgi:hypothetical protein